MDEPFPNSGSEFTHRPLTSSCSSLTRTQTPMPRSSALRHREGACGIWSRRSCPPLAFLKCPPALLAGAQGAYFLLLTRASPALGPEPPMLLQILAYPAMAGPDVCVLDPGSEPLCSCCPPRWSLKNGSRTR